jgi:hypothetical protein
MYIYICIVNPIVSPFHHSFFTHGCRATVPPQPDHVPCVQPRAAASTNAQAGPRLER